MSNLENHTKNHIWLPRIHSKVVQQILLGLGWNHIWSLIWYLRSVISGDVSPQESLRFSKTSVDRYF